MALVKPLYYLHIKKTAGSMFRQLLGQHFHLNDQLPIINIPILKSYTTEQLNKLKFILGHFDISILSFFNTKPLVITMLREPKDRFVSEFFYWKNPNDADNDPRKPVNMKDLTLELFAEIDNTRNVQVKSLSNGLLLPDRFFNNEGNQLLNKAKDMLQKIHFFGIVEHMQESVDMLYYYFKWKPTQLLRKVNVTRERKAISELAPMEEAAVNNANTLDLELYHFGEELFHQRYLNFLKAILGWKLARHYEHSPYEEVRTLVIPQLERNYQNEARKLKRVENLTYTFDRPLSGNNWWDREGIQNMIDYMWRWSSSEHATVDFPLMRDKPLELRFRVKSIVGNNFSVKTESGNALRLEIINSYEEAAGTLYSCILPTTKDWKRNMTTLIFHCENLKIPQNEVLNEKRQLGVAIDWIQILPAKPSVY